jgi:hypothetical protein
MNSFNWGEFQRLANNKATLVTKSRVPFQIMEATENAVYINVRSGEIHSISRINLEKAVAKIHAGVVLSGPKDYRDFIADDRPAYAWAILKHLGYIEE